MSTALAASGASPGDLGDPILYEHPGLPFAPTHDDVHSRREGEPIGDIPQVGDVIRYALRHSRWDLNGSLVPDWPARDAQGQWSPPCRVESTTGQPPLTRYAVHRVGGDGGMRDLDLDWWICEIIPPDGQLW